MASTYFLFLGPAPLLVLLRMLLFSHRVSLPSKPEMQRLSMMMSPMIGPDGTVPRLARTCRNTVGAKSDEMISPDLLLRNDVSRGHGGGYQYTLLLALL